MAKPGIVDMTKNPAPKFVLWGIDAEQQQSALSMVLAYAPDPKIPEATLVVACSSPKPEDYSCVRLMMPFAMFDAALKTGECVDMNDIPCQPVAIHPDSPLGQIASTHQGAIRAMADSPSMAVH